jgi:hypothetical protein
MPITVWGVQLLKDPDFSYVYYGLMSSSIRQRADVGDDPKIKWICNDLMPAGAASSSCSTTAAALHQQQAGATTRRIPIGDAMVRGVLANYAIGAVQVEAAIARMRLRTSHACEVARVVEPGASDEQLLPFALVEVCMAADHAARLLRCLTLAWPSPPLPRDPPDTVPNPKHTSDPLFARMRAMCGEDVARSSMLLLLLRDSVF